MNGRKPDCRLQEILGKYSARQLRLAFLTQMWNAKVDFSESLMTGEVRTMEAAFNVGRKFYMNPRSISENSVTELLHECESAGQPSPGRRASSG